VIIYVENNINP